MLIIAKWLIISRDKHSTNLAMIMINLQPIFNQP
jgi:hypothetical protein